jgi:hypothetical protein
MPLLENFKLNPGNKCSTPGWRFDFSAEKEGATQKDYSDISSDNRKTSIKIHGFFLENALHYQERWQLYLPAFQLEVGLEYVFFFYFLQ